MKLTKRIMALFLVVATVLSMNTISLNITSNAATESYKQSLRDKGFPEEYVTRLAQIHDLHPNWQFEPVMVTELNSKFTWDYIIASETTQTSSGTYYNLVTTGSYAPAPWASLGQANYTPYYEASNTNLYDSGWRQASTAAVKYFMDPRNFLNDGDIFMFESLNYNASVHTVANVATATSSSFMANIDCDGVSYAQHLVNLGSTYDVSPIFLAGRIKQEQGTGTSPLVNGTIGTKLWNLYNSTSDYDGSSPIWGSVSKDTVFTEAELKQYDGYYNFFNMGAAGTGVFAIYLGAGKEAKTGGWNTRAKSIAGGAKKVSEIYIEDYQASIYQQKFNVDPRSSRALWGQYMQNIGAPLTEGRSARAAYESIGALESAHLFQIPVYGGMPASPCADPANGNSYYSPTVCTATVSIKEGSGTVGFSANNSTSISVTPGSSVNYFVTPATGYYVRSITVGGVPVTVQNNGGNYVYSSTLTSNTAIEVSFALDINPVDIVFNSQDIMNWVISGNVSVGVAVGLGTEGDWHGLFVSPSTVDNDPQANFDFTKTETFNASEYKYMTLVAKTTAANKSASMFLCAGDTINPTAECHVSWQWINDGLWHEYVIDLSGLEKWTGTVNKIRFDFFDGTTEANSVLKLQAMRFSKTAPSQASISTNASLYTVGQSITINYSGLSSYYNTELPLKPFVAIYADGTEPGKGASVQYTYVNNNSGTLTFPTQATGGTNTGNLPVGNYTAWLGFDGTDASGNSYILNNVHMNGLEGYSFAVVQDMSSGDTDYTSGTGTMSNQAVINAVAGDNVSTAMQNIMTLTDSSNVTIKDSEGDSVLMSATVKTGMIATVDGASYTIVVKGDVDCDGAVTVADASATYSYLMGKATLSNASKDAAKGNSSSGSINILDVMNLLNMI